MSSSTLRNIGPALGIFLVSLVVFSAFLGAVPLFDWDEVNFAEIAREMVLTGEYGRVFIDFVPFWEKPPFFFWLQAASMQIWGIGEFAARFPNAVCGAITLTLLYILGEWLHDRRFGLLWALAFGGSILPHLYFRSGIIDPWFNLFIFSSIACIIGFIAKPQKRLLFLAGVCMGLAVLTKGPVGWLIVAITTGGYWLVNRMRPPFGIRQFVIYSGIALLVFGLWYGTETIRNGPWFVIQFITYQLELLTRPGAGHSGFPGYHLVVLLFGCFPASVLALRPVFRRKSREGVVRVFEQWVISLLLVVLVLFSLVQSKIVHYSSLCYFPITFFATRYIWRLHISAGHIGLWQKVGIAAIGSLYMLVAVTLVWIGRHPDSIGNLITLDSNAVAALSMDVHWNWWDVLPATWILIALGGIMIRRFSVYGKTVLLYICFGLFTWTAIACWIGKIQQYSQGPATGFFQSLRGKDVYAVTWGYKSYSQFWDFRKPVPEGFHDGGDDDLTYQSAYSDAHFLLTNSAIRKDVYVVTKVDKADEFLRTYPDVMLLGKEGLFVFFVKHPGPSSE